MLSLLTTPTTAIICLAEGHIGSLNDSWHEIASKPDAGYGTDDWRRKVVLASTNAWCDIDNVGDPNLPSGRYVSGVTLIEERETRVIGICVPWHFAHVSTGRRDREPWQDHVRYLEVLADILDRQPAHIPTILVGDLNQYVPRRTAPEKAYAALQDALLGRYEIATSGLLEPLHVPAIDHVLHSHHLAPSNVRVLDKVGASGKRLSDHLGLVVACEWKNGK